MQKAVFFRQQGQGPYKECNNGDEREVFAMAILVSGGAGYIGSHTCIELLNSGYDVVVSDK